MGDGAAAAAPSRFGTICVFCGSNAGRRKVFGDAALDLGHELVRRGIDLVYGGGSIGLMGLIARTVLGGSRRVVGVIPRTLMPVEISGESVGEVIVVSDMHERKAEMARRSEAFVALPGDMFNITSLFLPSPITLVIDNSSLTCLLISVRGLWNNGGAVGDDNLVSTWNS
ncbi:hypothetical protein E2562_025985 [Oryza meyeriana var. granulata]|uniref:Cytokinin riboside 5'-monophosphate phosphoribohydrolase n=1 Tax=Oryza meyeriana var. granulata TaxID=110450 RepID=A0A6G1EPD3_9ORYZ|nr:hypothetical protein E2562_025985 [Oryza meyeriana var. granulata]